MHETSFEEALEQILAKDRRYHRDAYLFVREALDYTQRTLARGSHGEIRHVTGQELLAGIREFALTQFGPMCLTVFQEWGIRRGEDFGNIVFNMVEANWLAKTDKDTLADFQGVYNFDTAFHQPFLPKCKRVGQTSPESEPSKT